METVTGTVSAKRKDGKGICINDEWYSVFKADDLFHVERGDDVVFNYIQKGNFKNIKGKVNKSGTGSTGGSSNSSGTRSHYSVGVEVGHASNLAMRMMEQADDTFDVGSTEYYRQFAEYTLKMHRVMAGIKAKVEKGDYTLPDAPTPEPEPVAEPVVEDVTVPDEDDLF